MSAEDTVEVEFYSVWPNLGKKFSQQLGEIRTDTASLKPVVRGVGLDAAGDFSDLDGIAANAVQAYEIGKQDFHNKFRTHYNKTADVFEIAYNNGTEEVPNWYTTWWINEDGHVTQQNTPTTVSNVGAGEGWFKQKVGVDLEFKSITATSPITIVNDGNTVDVDGSALVSTYSSDEAAAPSGNADTGVEIILSDTGKTGNDLPFKAIAAGPNIVVSNTGTAIKIESTAQVVEFYGISVGHDDGSQNYPEVHNFLVNRTDFYVTQQTTDPSNKTIILNSIGDPFNSDDYVAVAGDAMTGPLTQADGAEALPSYTFTDDTSMGITRKAANDLAVSIAGSYHTRFLSDRLFLGQGLQVTNTGSESAPDIYFFPDSDTGLFQNAAGDGSIAFTTDGERAGYFDNDQNFFVKNNISATFVQAGLGVFYTATFSDKFFAMRDGEVDDVAFGWLSNQGTGLYLGTSPSDPTLNIAVGGARKLYVDNVDNAIVITNTLRSTLTGTAAYPMYSWLSDQGTGLYLRDTDPNSELGFATGPSLGAGVEAGYIDVNQKWWFTNDLDAAGDIHAQGDVATTDEAYGATWDSSSNVPTKNAVYDKLEAALLVRETESGGGSFSMPVAFDSTRFYVSSGGDGNAVVALNESVFTADNHQGLHNINNLNDGGLGVDESMAMSVGAGAGLLHFYISNNGAGKGPRDTITVQFGGNDYEYTPGEPFAMTPAGSDSSPATRYLWLQLSGSTPVLTEGTSDWPSNTAHARIATAVVQTASGVESNGALKLQAWTDHPTEPSGAGDGTRGERGHLHSLAERLRVEPAVWISGMALTAPTESQTDPIYVQTTSGTGYQMHKHNIPTFDSDPGGDNDPIFAVNAGTTDDGGPYAEVHDLGPDITRYSDDSAIGNADHYTFIVWASINENQQNSHLFLNVPGGGYGTSAAALTDASGHRNYQIPQAYLGTAIYLCEFQIGRSGGGGTYTVESVKDLRGTPGTSIGGTGTSSAGEANTASNLGAGAGVFAQKNSIDLEFKSLRSQDSTISVTNSSTEIDISATGTFYTNVEALRFLAPDGDVNNPAFSFISNPDTGLFLDSLDDLSIVQDGVTFLRIVGSRLVSTAQIYSDSAGSKTTPTFSWHGDRNTGMYQNSANDGSVAFSANGTRAGYFSATRDFFVTNDITGGGDLTVDGDVTGVVDLDAFGDLTAGRVEAGLGTFYNQLHVKSHGTSATKLAIRFDSPDDGFWNNPAGVGTTYVVSSSQSIQWWNSNGTTLAKRIDLRNGSAAATPALAFRSDTNTGLYQDTNGDDNELRITTGGVYAAHFDAGQNLHVVNDVNLGGALINVPDEITSDSAGVAASIATLNTEVTTDGDSNLDNVTLANGVTGQVKHIYCVVETHAADTWKITPATMCGGTQITFAGVGEGCTLVFADSEGWCVVANNGGTIT